MKKFLLIVLMLSFAVTAYGATFTITIPDNKVEGVLDAFASYTSYQETVSNSDYDPEDEESESTIANPISKADNAKNCVKAFIRHIYISNQVNLAVDSVKDTAVSEASDDVSGVSVE